MTVAYRTSIVPIFFVSDTHFGHRAMAEHWRLGKYNYGTTLMAGVERKDAMDEELINQWNFIVPTYGIVFHLGDVSFRNSTQTGEILNRLNGEVHLVPGNHDKKHLNVVQDWGWTVLPPLVNIDVNDQRLVLCHYALRSWDRMHFGAWQLHGHSHGNLAPTGGKQLDVGVDCELVTRELRPISFDEVSRYIAGVQFIPVDHHLPKE
jgi:calcineurin-like phosphoesterase family protein